MIGDLVRIVADWLDDPVDGVAALLPSVPRDGGDPEPAAPAIQDETRDARAARGRLPEQTTALVVVSREASLVAQNVVTDDGFARAELFVFYTVRNVEASAAKRDAGYVLRAAGWSLRKLYRAPVDDPRRSRNQITLLEVGPIAVLSWDESLVDSHVVGACTCTVTARDGFAL